MKYQFNKISLQKLEKDLEIRLRALPTLKAKETALRQEVKKAQQRLSEIENELAMLNKTMEQFLSLWAEYPDLLSISHVALIEKNIAGIKIFQVSHVEFQIVRAGLFHQRAWVVEGTELLKKRLKLVLESRVWKKNLELLTQARRKTTQKVNLYEKVQIPEFQNAIRRIKGFLEDVENLSRASQKIIKKRRPA
ncbi:MAG: hypothetical protein NZM25_01990 [Leptospiraceae bacterium]|nr:hypothetical protein [Leptospiraceae bacterium]MDW8306947.1 V-type ATP synthase subunit D [Leptospiraceae bacterium]